MLQDMKTEILYEPAFDCLHSIFMLREGKWIVREATVSCRRSDFIPMYTRLQRASRNMGRAEEILTRSQRKKNFTFAIFDLRQLAFSQK